MFAGVLALIGLFGATADDCREAYAAVRYREAGTACLDAIPSTPPDQLAGIYRLAALSLAALGDEEQASALFAGLLALDPLAELSPAISPKLRVLFERARARGAAARVRLVARTTTLARQDLPMTLEVSVDDGAPHPVTEVIATAGAARASAPRDGGRALIQLPAPGKAGPWEIDLAARDRFHGRLATAALSIDVAPLHPPRPAWLSWKGWGVAAGAVAAGALVAGLVSRQSFLSAQRDVFADAASTDLQRAQATAWAADTGFVVAGALTLGAAVLLATEPAP